VHPSVTQFDVHYFVKYSDGVYETTIEGDPISYHLSHQGFAKDNPQLKSLPNDLRRAIWDLTARCRPPTYRETVSDKGREM
jgi:hypothetical protein